MTSSVDQHTALLAAEKMSLVNKPDFKKKKIESSKKFLGPSLNG